MIAKVERQEDERVNTEGGVEYQFEEVFSRSEETNDAEEHRDS